VNYLVPASPEVIGHHVRQHTRQCPSGGIDERWCPCGVFEICAEHIRDQLHRYRAHEIHRELGGGQ